MADEEEEAELHGAERRALQALPTESTPPAGLEDRIVRELRGRGLLRGPGLRVGGRGVGLAVAAGLFVAGLGLGAVGSRWTRPSAVAQPTNRGALFLLLLYDGAGTPEDGPAEEAARVAEYGAWAADLRRSGHLVGAEKLAPQARLLGEGGSRPGPPEARGYFLVRATSFDEALAIARGCPHLRHGGRVALQAVAAT